MKFVRNPFGKKEPDDHSVVITLPSDLIIEISPTIGGGPETVPILIHGSEIKIKVTDLMTPQQAQVFSMRFADRISEITKKRLVDGNFGIRRND